MSGSPVPAETLSVEYSMKIVSISLSSSVSGSLTAGASSSASCSALPRTIPLDLSESFLKY